MPQNRVLSGVITVTTAGTAVPGPDAAPWQSVEKGGGFLLSAPLANTGLIFVGNDGTGDVASTNGYELKAGAQTFIACSNLNEVWFDSSVSGEKVTWLKA